MLSIKDYSLAAKEKVKYTESAESKQKVKGDEL